MTAAGAIRTYSLADRTGGARFGIRDENSITRIQEAHRHEYCQIQLNLAGSTEQQIAAVTRPLAPGGLSFVMPYRVHRIVHPPRSRFFVISFSPAFLRPDIAIDPLNFEDVPLDRAPEMAPFLFQEYVDFRLTGSDLRLAQDYCRRMQAEHGEGGYLAGEVIRAHLLLLISLVCRRHEPVLRRLAEGQAQRGSRRDALARVMRYVRENLSRRLQLTDAARAAGLSANYLAHLIRKETGRTYVDLVTERRMEKAQELLAHTSLRVREIAVQVGFDDEAYFTRRFRQCCRLTPSAFRRRAAKARER